MTTSHLRQQPTSPCFAVLAVPQVLYSLLLAVPWRDFHPLLNSCSAARSLFRSPDLRDIILARFIPGYHFDHREHDVYVSIHDLDLFLISQKFPLHHYPTYALRSLSSPYESAEQNLRLSALTQAHSRIVLLLQSLVHRSAIPINPEPREQLTPLPILLRQLTFPAPLSYHPPKLKHKSLPEPSRPSVTDSLSYRRLSLFRTTATTLPPPAEPLVLKGYANSWRRSLFRHSASPHKRKVSTGSSTSASRSSPSPPSISRSTTPTPTTSTSSTSSPSPPPLSYSTTSSADSFIPSTSPHSLHFATSRARAPVLRTYVPCTELTNDSASVLQCEEQLILSGLWSHLSAGDIVCNLGYVPRHSGSDDALGNSKSSEYRHKWLIFNGTYLIPYTPAGPLSLPLDDPLSLPSPFYYSHILPSSPLANPVFSISRMPAIRGWRSERAPVLTLQLLSTRVPSKPSPSGVAIARKYMWTALVERTQEGEPDEMGEGWYGDWVLETEGTREGRQTLLNWLGGGYAGPPREWELVRERSGMGKKDRRGTVWLKLLHARGEDWYHGGAVNDEGNECESEGEPEGGGEEVKSITHSSV